MVSKLAVLPKLLLSFIKVGRGDRLHSMGAPSFIYYPVTAQLRIIVFNIFYRFFMKYQASLRSAVGMMALSTRYWPVAEWIKNKVCKSFYTYLIG